VNRKSIAFIPIAIGLLTICVPSLAFANSIRQGGTCQSIDAQRFQEGYSFTCVKAGKSITNLSGKKLVWKQSSFRKLEWTTSTSSTIAVLNTLHLGYWKKSESPDYSGFDGQVFISSLPCKLYMANSSDAQLFIWNRQVNGNGYGGTWTHTDSQFWVVNEPNYGPAPCVSYFSLNYGGPRITQ
jgi:hypothetical protein